MKLVQFKIKPVYTDSLFWFNFQDPTHIARENPIFFNNTINSYPYVTFVGSITEANVIYY